MDKKAAFTKAHETTRKIRRDFPTCDYRVTFGACLSLIIKNAKIKKLVKIGGKQWTKGSENRVYFNAPEDFIGDEGRKISGKFWYDINSGKFESYNIAVEAAQKIEAAIRAAA